MHYFIGNKDTIVSQRRVSKVKAHKLRFTDRFNLPFRDKIIRENYIYLAFKLHSRAKLFPVHEYIERACLFIFQKNVATILHTFHSLDADTHLGRIRLRDEETARRHKTMSWEV